MEFKARKALFKTTIKRGQETVATGKINSTLYTRETDENLSPTGWLKEVVTGKLLTET